MKGRLLAVPWLVCDCGWAKGSSLRKWARQPSGRLVSRVSRFSVFVVAFCVPGIGPRPPRLGRAARPRLNEGGSGD